MIAFLDEEQVRQVLRMDDIIPAMERALVEFSAGRIAQPVRRLLPVEPACGGYRLVFSAAGGMRPDLSAPANIVEAPGETVYGILYLLPLRKFARLDNSEGRQYDYLWTDVEDAGGNIVSAVTYKVPQAVPEGRLGRRYLELIRGAARQRGLPADYLAFRDRVEARE